MGSTGYFDTDHHSRSSAATSPSPSDCLSASAAGHSDIFARPMSPTPAPFVYINGWPGVGKLAVAECLTLLLGEDKAHLVDVNDLGTDKNAWDLHTHEENPGDELTRLLSEPRRSRRLAIMTNCTPDTPSGRTVAATYAAAASRAGRLFVPVCLECQPEERLQRMHSLERQYSQRERKRSHDENVRPAFGRKLTFQGRHEEHGNRRALTLDITNMEALQAAVQVLEFVNDEVARFEEEWCCGSAMATPTEEGTEWRQLGAA